MWLHQQPPGHLMKPAAPVTVSYVNKIHRAVVFTTPLVILDLSHRSVHQHQASGAQQRSHSPVGQSDISVTMLRAFFLECPFKVAPPLHHSRQKIGTSRIKTRIKTQRHTQPARRRRHVGSRNLKIASVTETFLDGNFKPLKEFHRIQMIERSQRIELVQAGHDISIFDVRQPADVHDEVAVTTKRSEFVTGTLNITICKP